jgi:proteic killer suppression protein
MLKSISMNCFNHINASLSLFPNVLCCIVTLDVINVMRHHFSMIISYKCKDTEKLASGRRVRRFVSFERVALRKIRQLQAASQLDDLKVPPGNMLEPLHGDRQGQHSIRINRQFRVCFRWSNAGAEDVEIVDYH